MASQLQKWFGKSCSLLAGPPLYSDRKQIVSICHTQINESEKYREAYHIVGKSGIHFVACVGYELADNAIVIRLIRQIQSTNHGERC